MVGRPPSSTEQSEPLSEGKATLLELLLAKRPRSEPLIERHPRGRIGESNRFPASLAQQSIWFIDRFDGGGAAYNIPIAVELRGALNRDALQWALDELVCRHEPLRTLFRDTDGSPEQEIQENQPFVLPVLDLTESSDKERMAEVERQKAEEAQARFDLSSGPLIRGRLLCLQPLEHVLLLTMHHIVSDGWSIDILMRELGTLYDAYKNGPANSLPALPIQYADFALWQRQWLAGNAALNQLSYWRSRLQGATSALELPTDRPRPAVRRFRGRSVELALDDALSDRLKALSRRHGLTVFMLMCGAWAVLMSRLTGQDDLSIGTPVANRRRDALEDLVGLFVNTLVLRFSLKSGTSLSEFFAHVKEVTLGAFDHQEVPFEQLVEVIRPQRPAGEHPMFQTMFTFRTVQVRQWSVGGLTATLHEIDNRASKFDLLLSMEERGGRLTGNVQYDEDLFDRGTVMRWLGCFTALLRGMVSREKCCLGDLPILQERERHAVVHLFNETGWPHTPDKLIHELFEAQVEHRRATPAVVYEGHSLSYEELNDRANQVARQLRQKGVCTETLVGLYIDRSVEMIVGMLAILKAGGAYVPIDPHSPPERIATILEDAAPQVVLTQGSLESNLPSSLAKLIALDEPGLGARYHVSNLSTATRESRSDRLAYVIYTSGSTGKPKGVMIEHTGVVNLWQGLERLYDPCSNIQRVGLNASLNFDASVQQLVQLLSGRTLYVLPQETRMDGSKLLAFLREHRIDAVDCTPSQLKSWIAAGLLHGHDCPLKLVLVGGEAIDSDLWSKLSRCPDISFYNMYGPTECTVDCTVARLNNDTTTPNIGRPMENRSILILDGRRQPVPVGVKGEIYIGGLGVARGYLNNPALTEERFVKNPFSVEHPMRLYKSGDMGRWREDGAIEYLGRNDDQVKIRGYRIELGEIESQLSLHDSVQEAVVVVREDAPGEKRLVAYVKTRHPGGLDSGELRAYLRKKLPEYMVPTAIVRMDALPMTLSGKVNRRDLPAPSSEAYAMSPYEAPEGDMEQKLAAIWKGLLQVEQVGRNDSFFELGGHSLLVLRALFEMNEVLATTLNVADVYQSPTVRSLAARIGGATSAMEYVDLRREAVLQPDIIARPGSGSIRVESILLTGATGFVGRFLLWQLIRDTDATIYCLVRASTQQDAANRLKATLTKWDLWRDDFERRVIAIAGDAKLPRLGMNERTFQVLQAEVDEIYHCAASVNHLETYEMAKPANVGVATELVRLAASGTPKPIHFVSSVSVFSANGCRTGRLVDEQTDTEHERHPASEGYVASKWVSEKIFMMARARGIPCNIFRLGLVWADSQQGRYDELQREYRVLKSSLLAGCGIEDYRFDLSPTPVDCASRAIVFLAARHRYDSRTFHICPSGQMARGLFEVLNESSATPLRILPHYDWISEIKGLHRQGRSSPVVPLIEFAFSMDRTTFTQHCSSTQSASPRIEASRTIEELRHGAIELPALNQELILTCIRDMVARDRELKAWTNPRDTLSLSRRRA